MLNIPQSDAEYLRQSIAKGEAILVLGAGASAESLSQSGKPPKMANDLARLVASECGLPSANDSLQEVLSAAFGDKLLNEIRLKSILTREYYKCTPGADLLGLINFTWRRLYTWNIDDTLENINEKKKQTFKIYNGLVDKATPTSDDLSYLDVIFLHGQISKPEHRFILTEEEYFNTINKRKHYWYQQLAQDYLTYCTIFIGSRLDEPVLKAEIDRAKSDNVSNDSRSFLM